MTDADYWEKRANNAWEQLDKAGVDLLAARAEVAELEALNLRMAQECDRNFREAEEARAEVRALLHIRATLEGEIARLNSEGAALRGKEELLLANAYNAGWRAALDDLRAKVESGWVPELDHEARVAVVALLDGADS